MAPRLTGETADAYLGVWLESARTGRPVDAAKVLRDALAAGRSRKALNRLRLAGARVAARSPLPPSPQPRTRPRQPRPRQKARRSLSRAAGAPERPSRGFR